MYIEAYSLHYMAGWLHHIPFAIWHRHAVLASDRCCTALVPEVTDDLLDCLFFSHKALFIWRWPPMQPQAPWWSRGLLLLVFWDYIYLKWIGVEWLTVFARALACARMWTYIFRKIHYLSIVCLTQITKLNCCMTGLLFGCLRDFLLLYRVNHHWNVFIRWPFLGFKKLLHTVCLKNFICNTQRIYIHVFVKLHRIKSNPSRSKVFLSHAHHSTFTLLGDISQESLSFVEIKTVKREENKTVKWHPGVTRL